MKTKKVVVGAIAASMLPLSAFPGSAVAAGETVQISASKETAKAGETFSVEVSLADVPSSGIQGIDFSIEFDSSLITITSVEEGTLVKNAAASDPTADGVKLFSVYAPEGKNYVNVAWSNSYTDPSYWIKSDGVFCVINGTVNDGVTSGTADIKLGAIKRETRPESGSDNGSVGIGYAKDGKSYSYDVNVTNGSVEIGQPTTTSTTTTPGTTSGGSGKYLKGDANESGDVNMADAVAIMRFQADPDSYGLTAQGKINGDVVGNGDGVTNNDALQIQKYEAGIVTEL
uniref:Scaffoldin C n=1 Tax=Ruminococcus flavefaciens TaxID=1265 RepID=G9FET6_RUMFL|nr:scaffoldin C [Ruminococcus flavefaciens]